MGFLCAFVFLWQPLFVHKKTIFIRLATGGQVITTGMDLASLECQPDFFFKLTDYTATKRKVCLVGAWEHRTCQKMAKKRFFVSLERCCRNVAFFFPECWEGCHGE